MTQSAITSKFGYKSCHPLQQNKRGGEINITLVSKPEQIVFLPVVCETNSLFLKFKYPALK
jgi:hypothetical protein